MSNQLSVYFDTSTGDTVVLAVEPQALYIIKRAQNGTLGDPEPATSADHSISNLVHCSSELLHFENEPFPFPNVRAVLSQRFRISQLTEWFARILDPETPKTLVRRAIIHFEGLYKDSDKETQTAFEQHLCSYTFPLGTHFLNHPFEQGSLGENIFLALAKHKLHPSPPSAPSSTKP